MLAGPALSFQQSGVVSICKMPKVGTPGGLRRSVMRIGVILSAGFLALSALKTSPALASPWAEVGDNQLRSDIQVLAGADVIDSITSHWPLPWESVIAEIDRAHLDRRPLAVQSAAARLLERARGETDDGVSASFHADFTNKPSVVYGFDGMGRGDGQAQLSIGGNSGAFSGRLSLGAITQNFGGKPNKLMLDGTYAAVRLGGVRVYAGYLDHWWGPGEISALSLSNNARPIPQVGIERSSTAASSWPILRWLGPWQWQFFVGVLDGPQIKSNVLYNAMHLTINPLPGLELGVSKTEQFCGEGHPCSPIKDYLANIDFSTHANNVNGEGSFEAKYSNKLAGVPFQIYAQLMNEDYSLAHNSGTSHLFGMNVFLPTGNNPLKLTAEFADTVATRTMFGFGERIYGFTYADYEFIDGMRYRGRTMGASLDNDATLLSLRGSWSDAADRFYQLSLHHAVIGNSRSVGANIVSPIPVLLNLAEARVSLPLEWTGNRMRLDLAGRLQDDQPRPSRGFAAGIEVALRMNL